MCIQLLDMGPFYVSLCREVQRPVDQTLVDKLKAINETKLKVIN